MFRRNHKKVVLLWCLATTFCCETTSPQQKAAPQPPEPNYLQAVAAGSIFVYDPQAKACEEPPPNTVRLPRGSGFVVGISKKGASGDKWVGWKFLVTAKHVVGNLDRIILRLNRTDRPQFTCFELVIHRAGPELNLFESPVGVDLLAISIPDIPNTDPTVVAYSLILDEETMASREIGVGTEVFTVGYLFGYSGNTQNRPVTKFGKIALLTEDRWYFSEVSNSLEQAYVIELQNIPGLSGAPVMVHGFEFKSSPFSYRKLPPFVVGVVKGLMMAPLPNGQKISQGLAAVEPARELRALMLRIAEVLKAGGAEVQID